MTTEKIIIMIESLKSDGYLVVSDDLPELNIYVQGSENITTAVPAAIKYLYKHNRKMNVMVLMEVPALDTPNQQVPKETRRTVELQELAA